MKIVDLTHPLSDRADDPRHGRAAFHDIARWERDGYRMSQEAAQRHRDARRRAVAPSRATATRWTRSTCAARCDAVTLDVSGRGRACCPWRSSSRSSTQVRAGDLVLPATPATARDSGPRRTGPAGPTRTPTRRGRWMERRISVHRLRRPLRRPGRHAGLRAAPDLARGRPADPREPREPRPALPARAPVVGRAAEGAWRERRARSACWRCYSRNCSEGTASSDAGWHDRRPTRQATPSRVLSPRPRRRLRNVGRGRDHRRSRSRSPT